MVRFKPPGSSTWYNVSSDAGARAATAREAAKKAAATKSSTYRGPTVAQIAAGTLAATPATIDHRQSARTAALTRSGIRAGQTPAQAVVQATTTVYGAKSAQATRAKAILDKQKADIARGVITRVQDLPRSPHDMPLTPAQIHRREKLFEDAKSETLLEALKGKSGEIIKYQVIPTEQKARRAYLDLQSAESKLQTGEAQLYIAEQRLAKWDKYIKDDAFVGSEAQYDKYVQDFNSYSNVSNRYDKTYTTYATAFNKSDITGKKLEQYKTEAHRAKFGGLLGKYEDIELKVSQKIPTLADISLKGAKFRTKHPEIADKIYTAFEKAHGKTESVGTQTQQNALAGYTYGSYTALQNEPVKTSIIFAASLGSVKAFSMVGKVGKAYGAGKWSKRMGKAAQLGLIGYYGYTSTNYIMSAPNAYVAGQRAAKIMYTEILPMAVGIKVGVAAPKVTKIVIRKVGFISKKFKAGTKKMLSDNKAMINAGKSETQRLAELVKSEEKRLGRPLLESEYNALKALVKKPKTIKTAKDIFKKIDESYERKVKSGEYKEVKVGTGAQQQIQLVKMKQKPLTQQSLKEVVKLKEQFELIIKPVVKQKVVQKPVQKVKVITDSQKAEAIRLKQKAVQRQASYQKEMQALADQMPSFKRKVVVKTVQKQVLKDKSITKQIAELKQRYMQKLITKQVYEQKLAQLNKQALKLAQSQKQTLKQAQKTVSSLTVAVVSLSTIKEMQKQFQSTVPLSKVKPKQEVKAKVKALPKTRARAVLTPKQKAAVKAAATLKAVEKAKKARAAKAKPKEIVKPIIQPPIPTMRKPTKKKTIKKRTVVTKLNQKNLNVVATFKQLIGGL